MSALTRTYISLAISRDEERLKHFTPLLLSSAGQQAFTLYEQHLREQDHLTATRKTTYIADLWGFIVWYEMSWNVSAHELCNEISSSKERRSKFPET